MIEQSTITPQGEGIIMIEGAMTFSTVNQLLANSQTYFVSQSELLIDLTKVAQADSAGVALLVEWLRIAKCQQAVLNFRNIPAQMWAIIEVSGLEDRLPLVNAP